jgi:gliding motility-associated-like protein
MTAKASVCNPILLLAVLLSFSFTSFAQLHSNFSATPLSGCSPLVVNFTDLSTGNPTEWHWDLGNGTTSIAQNPSTTYFNAGAYTIRLIVLNAAGNADTLVRTQYITVQGKPSVAFTGSPLTGCFPLPVQFANQTTPGSGTITNWEWDFGDGATSALQNPSHTYTAAGNYNVTLRATNNFGCFSTLTKPQYVKVSTGVQANFTNTQPTNCSPPSIINFTNLSTGSGTLTYLWTFGDGATSTQISPSHTYTATGVYTVSLTVTNSVGCTHTFTVPNAVSIGIVHAAFTNPTTACVNNAVLFTNTSVPVPSSVVWTFGDGTTSTSLNPSKTYTAAGFYPVKLVANFGSCSDSAFGFIRIVDNPTANFTGSPIASCKAPLTVNFINQSNGAVSYVWDFGDGTTSTQFNPTHTYNAVGNYTVSLTATNANGCTHTFTQNDYVKIQPPSASINNLPYKNCAPLTHTFTATINSVVPVISYLWDFGDGTTSTLPNPTHTFPLGRYDIKLIITTAGGCTDTVFVPEGIVASSKPVANFSANPRDVCAFTPVNFTDLSTGTVTQWLWDFGDGATSVEQHPIHEYQDTGYFNVRLIVWNEGCPDTIQLNNYIHIKPPIASFTPSFVCTTPTTRVFTDQSIGADTWTWDFGDTNTSTQQNPTHTYASVGNYTVTLLVYNNTTGCSHTKTVPIKVMIEKAMFIATETVICRNTSTSFTAQDNIAANIASYDWDFGDNTTGTGINPSHIYTLAGNYTVRLIITDILGCKDTLVKPLYIRVDGPTAAFAPLPTGNCIQSAMVFTDNSTTDGVHPITTWTWNFGDGNIVSFTAPPFFHNYTTSGVYTVSLKVIDSKGCVDSVTSGTSMIISQPVASFMSADTISCPNKPIVFTNTSTGPSLTYKWFFGDNTTSTDAAPTHTYTSDGLYTVKLAITDTYGCTDTLTKQTYIKIASPHSNFTMSDSVSTCPPLIVNFTNTSSNFNSVYWDFGDSTSTSSDNPSHFYSYPGVYNVRLGITSPGGCTDTITKQIRVTGPQGNFTYGPLAGCSPLQVTLTATTQNRLSFVWDFNDGNILSTNDSVVTYTYQNPGNFVPKMILIDAGGCQVPVTGIDTIHVTGVTANFGFLANALCDSAIVSFSDSSISTDGIAGYQWNFGDGGTSIQQNPTHFYTTPGLYFPKLIVTTLSGCTDTVQLPTPVKIVASPQALITTTPNGCTPLTATFNGSLLVPDTSALVWSWNLGNGNLSTLQNPPPQVYTTPTTYTIELIVTNSTGCKDTVNKTIEAFRIPIVNAGVDALVCEGKGTALQASGATTYTWSPPTGLSCTNCDNPTATPRDTISYTVIGTTTQGCSNSDLVTINVKHPFVMESSKGKEICKGKSVRLIASGAYTYSWSPAAGLSSTTSSSTLATPNVTTNYMVVGTDKEGCFKDTNFIPIKVYNYPTVFAGNDTTINVSQTAILKPTLSADVTNVVWSPPGTIVSSNYPSVVVKPKETTNYLVEVTNAGGCKTIDNVTVNVLCNGANVFIPNTFSPNGDGANDIFYPRGTGLFRIKALRIFNRWGELIFERGNFVANDASVGWDGTYKGVQLTPDVYVYTADIVCDNNTTLVLKGNVALIK